MVTLSYRWAWTALIGVAFLCLLCASVVVVDAVRGRPFKWFFAIYAVLALVWTVRLLRNVRWLRRERLTPDADTPPWRRAGSHRVLDERV